jgi:hypothetical protein
MVLLRCIRPDRVLTAAREFVGGINVHFNKPTDLSLKDIHR